jgi:hypothetical protein
LSWENYYVLVQLPMMIKLMWHMVNSDGHFLGSTLFLSCSTLWHVIFTVGSLYSTCCTKLSTNCCLHISDLLKPRLQHMSFIT